MCKLYECEKQAEYPYPYCSMSCGIKFKEDVKNFKMFEDGMPSSNWYGNKSPHNWAVGKLEHMSRKTINL